MYSTALFNNPNIHDWVLAFASNITRLQILTIGNNALKSIVLFFVQRRCDNMRRTRINVDEFKNPLLPKDYLKLFDYVKSKNYVDKLMQDIEKWKYEYINLVPPKITSNYEVRYEKLNFNPTDKVGDYVEKKVDMEIKIDTIYRKLKAILQNCNFEELDFFDMHYYNKMSDTMINNKIDVGHTKIEHIKRSCIIKIALGFENAVRN